MSDRDAQNVRPAGSLPRAASEAETVVHPQLAPDKPLRGDPTDVHPTMSESTPEESTDVDNVPSRDGRRPPGASPAPDGTVIGPAPAPPATTPPAAPPPAAPPPAAPLPAAAPQYPELTGGLMRVDQQAPPLLPGSIVGRYVVHSRIREGALGTVYRVHDPRLGRDVALEIWRVTTRLPAAASPPGMRFLQEARSLAKLSHPNVIAIHDVGAVGPDVYVTMEIVQGVPLGRWLAAAPRSLGEILEVFVAAGRGLAAAHAAGLLHRDFKPEHVLVGKRGVWVMDFGLTRTLAAALAAEQPPEQRPERPAAPPAAPAEELPSLADNYDDATQVADTFYSRPPSMPGFDEVDDAPATEIDINLREVLGLDASEMSGAEDEPGLPRLGSSIPEPVAPPRPAAPGPAGPSPALGTPAYMAPEQHAGGRVDARTDQFSFCVALYEAVCGVRPFVGSAADVIAERMRAGRVTPMAPGDEAPAWLDALLRRGLAADASARHPSMETLLAELDGQRPRYGRWLWRGALAVVVLGVLALGILYAIAGGLPGCEDGEERMTEVWNQQVARIAGAAFQASGAPQAQDSHARVVDHLDDYARAWVQARAAVCEAPDADSDQDRAMRARRLACLDRRLDRFRALTRVLTEFPDRSVTEGGVAAALALPRVETCTGGSAPPAPALPEDEAARATIEAVRAELDELAIRLGLGGPEPRVEPARALVERADATGFAPAQARARLVLGQAQAAAGEHAAAAATLREVLPLAEQAGDGDVLATAWSELVWVIGRDQGRPEAALALRADAEAAAKRALEPRVREAELASRLGALLSDLGRHGQAQKHMERALALLAEARGPAHPSAAEPLAWLARALQGQSRHRDAQAHLERRLAVLEQHHGPGHARLIDALMDAGAGRLFLGDAAGAQDSFERALALETAWRGPRTARAGRVHGHIGRALHLQGAYADAIASLERAIAIEAERHGAQDPRVADTLVAKADVHLIRGEYADARDLLRRALDARAEQRAPAAPAVAAIRARLGLALAQLGDLSRARELLESALESLEAALGADHPDLAPALAGMGTLWRRSERYKRARRYFERLLDLQRTHRSATHPAVAEAHYEIGDTLLAASRPGAARAAFAQARAVYEQAGERPGEQAGAQPGAAPTPGPGLARALTGMGACDLRLDRPADAIPHLERALTIYTSRPGGELHMARARFLLARALWESRTDHARALALAQEAEAGFARAGAHASEEMAAVRAWLDSEDF